MPLRNISTVFEQTSVKRNNIDKTGIVQAYWYLLLFTARKHTVTMDANSSAITIDHQTPLIPKKTGRIKTVNVSNTSVRTNDMHQASIALDGKIKYRHNAADRHAYRCGCTRADKPQLPYADQQCI